MLATLLGWSQRCRPGAAEPLSRIRRRGQGEGEKEKAALRYLFVYINGVMTAHERDAALASGSIAYLLSDCGKVQLAGTEANRSLARA
jgi:hypothetical protein